jgi:hypothetical protein
VSIEGEILIRRPLDEVFDYVADQRHEPAFNPRMTNVEKLTGGPIGAGTRFSASTTTMGRELEMTIEYTVYERPGKLGSRTTMASAETVGTLTFTPDPVVTWMHWSWDVRPKHGSRILRPLIELVGRREENRIWQGLRRQLEAEPTGTGDTTAARDD